MIQDLGLLLIQAVSFPSHAHPTPMLPVTPFLFQSCPTFLPPFSLALAVLGSHSSRVSYSIRTSTSCPPIGPSL